MLGITVSMAFGTPLVKGVKKTFPYFVNKMMLLTYIFCFVRVQLCFGTTSIRTVQSYQKHFMLDVLSFWGINGVAFFNK